MEAFALLIREDDPYILADNEIIALTESEFYALHKAFHSDAITEEEFHYVVALEDLSFMQPADEAEVLSIREALPHCTACRYKRFKDRVRNLIKKYNIDTGVKKGCPVCGVKYPSCSEAVISHIHEHIDDLYGISYDARKACIDCVEKHVSQAYVLACEFNTGYTEYAALVYAHLSEAVAELPDNLGHLRTLLEFCMAKLSHTGKPFIPLGAIAKMISLYRTGMAGGAPEDSPKPENPYMELELTDDMIEELGIIKLSDSLTASLRNYLETADAVCRDGNPSEEQVRLTWEGEMARASECIAQIAPKLAGMLRNRRLIFVSDPWLADNAGLSNNDILAGL